MLLDYSALIALAIWIAFAAVGLWRSRARLPEAGPARTDPPGDEPPAVVSLMINRWRADEDAIDATLLDLAARGFLELRQPGDDPDETTVRLRKGDGRSLTPYEQQILDRVHHLSVNGETSLRSLAFGSWSEARRWRGAFYRAVVEEARNRGLSRRRLSRKTTQALLLGAVGPVLLTWFSWWWVARDLGANLADQLTGATIATIGLSIALYLVVDFGWSDQNTPEGQLAAAEWLAYRAHLEAVDGVADLAPADIASWGRDMAFASALGVLSTDEALVRLTPQARLRGRQA
ncbi:DUF2207 family protein [Dactylosporangium sucinum]|uniref:Predicted membrane protein YciQ-like C-terminal domain-containing protein n=1 Tax=Dactylosporangium sucinum TaxID=1424081 RepID=A0A917WVM4_9ACTN|nr:DUF2207 domain-containing protein [Dactylosporangium sucinum]GGM33126.1 hypothetical protein GCM10007977_038150 [Dactylosporangium sucinum]